MAAYFNALEIPTRSNKEWELCDMDKDRHEINQRAYEKEVRYGHGPYVSNGLPISPGIEGCCNLDPCWCRSDVIFYDGKPYDQKPFIQGHLRTRPGNVMYFEGKMVGPFNPGKSPLMYGPTRPKNRPMMSMCYNSIKDGKDYQPCCSASIYGDRQPPYANNLSKKLAYTKMGLPHGNTIGYFRFTPERICYDRVPPISRIEECCNCHPWDYDASHYFQDECPGKTCC